MLQAAIVQIFTYSAYGELLAIHNATGSQIANPSNLPLSQLAKTSLLYNGEGIDSRTGLYNFRARWYSASSGRFERLDPYAGNPNDPLSFNKYGYVHGNPILGADPSGNDFSIAGISVGNAMRIGFAGFAGGVAVNALRNNALNRPWYEGALEAGATGALLLPLMILNPEFAIFVVLYGLADSLGVAYRVFSDKNSTVAQKVYASLYIALNVFFARATVRAIEATPPIEPYQLGVISRPRMRWRQMDNGRGGKVDVYGQSESSSTTPGHAYTIEALAAVLAKSGRYVNIVLQRSWRTASDRANPDRSIPDLIAETPEGKFDAIEVRSNSDNAQALDTRMQQSMELLPQAAKGRRAVVDPVTHGEPAHPFVS